MSAPRRARGGATLTGLLAALVAAGSLAQGAAQVTAADAAPAAYPHDGPRQAWQYRRDVQVAAPGALVALELAPEVSAHALPDLRDLRLLATDGVELPYVLDRLAARQPAERFAGRLDDVRREAKQFSQWQVDFDATRTFERLELSVPQIGFAKRLRVEGSDDRNVWRLLVADAGIFEREWQGRLRQTAVAFAQPQSARYVRISADDQRSLPIDITGVDAVGPGGAVGTPWSRPAALIPDTATPPPAAQPGRRRFVLDTDPGLPIESVTLDAADQVFSRQVRLLERSANNGEQVLGAGRLFRLVVPSEQVSGSLLTLAVRAPGHGPLVLEIEDGDSPPLHALRVTLGGYAPRLLFSAPRTETLTLYYGNAATRAPLYDVQALSARVSVVSAAPAASLGAEQVNPRYVPAPPLRFLSTSGATLDVTRWRLQRRLSDVEREDIYSVTLDAHDLGALRADLADLRLADDAGHQVPYVLERDAREQWVALESAERPTDGSGRLRRYRLRLPERVAGARELLPWATLELDFAPSFFSRSARLFTEAGDGLRRPGERVLWAGRLERRDGQSEMLSVALDGEARHELTLEIDDGDDQALVPTRARVRVRVPRLTFKAGPGHLRLLLGCADAEPARYDIDALRRELLTYSATPLEVFASQDNSDHRRRVGDLLRHAPSSLLLWGTLAAAIVALLWLTVRMLRQSEAEGPPGPTA